MEDRETEVAEIMKQTGKDPGSDKPDIILDMGNVLLTYEPELYVEKLCRKEAREIIKKELFEGSDWPQQDLGNIDKEELFRRVSVRIPEEYWPDLKEVICGWSSLMRPLPGAREFLEELILKGYRLYVLSNAGHDFYEYFPRHYDLAVFSGLVVSCDLHVTKPDPLIYQTLIERYQLEPENCLFADDTERNIKGAEACGIHGVLFSGDFEILRQKIEELEKSRQQEGHWG